MNVGEMTLSSKWMRTNEWWRNDCLSQMDEHGWETRREKEDQETSKYARERERERARDKTATAEDVRAWLRRRARRVAEGGDAATAAVFVPLSTGVKEATNVEGEDYDDDEEEDRQTRPVTTTIAGLVKEAAELFHSRSYQGCLLILNQLLVQNETDPKVTSSKILPAL